MKPKETMPSLELDLINDAKWSLKNQNAEKYTLLFFYRGLHCPVCKKQLKEVQDCLGDFAERGVNVIAISMDSAERAKKTGKDWELDSLPVGYGLNEDKAREFGLFISTAISDSEPETFSEPGVFLVDRENNLFFSSVQSMPFTRPDTKGIISAIDFIEKKGYPARGTK